METANDATLAVILAAGAGTRFAGPTHKLMARLDGMTLVETSIRNVVAARIGPVLVVTGAADLAGLLASSFGAENGVRVIHNPNWADGQATSLHVAVTEAERLDVDAIIVGLADQPFVDPAAWRAVAASTAPIAIATYEGRRRNPVRLHRSIFAHLPTTGDEGARMVSRMRPDLVEEIPCPGSATDIDTLEDLESWQNRSSTNSP